MYSRKIDVLNYSIILFFLVFTIILTYKNDINISIDNLLYYIFAFFIMNFLSLCIVYLKYNTLGFLSHFSDYYKNIFNKFPKYTLKNMYHYNKDFIIQSSKASAELVIVFAISGFFIYNMQSLNYSLYDSVYANFDKLLNFDKVFLYFITKMDNTYLLKSFLKLCYTSFGFQLIFIIFTLIYTKKIYKLQIFIFLLSTTLFISCLISGLFPALGVYEYYNLTPDSFKENGIEFVVNPNYIEHLKELRSGIMKTFPPQELFQGIIVFPSFHASAATIFILCSLSLKYLKWFFIILNIFMIISTPLTGLHYLVDTVAGIFIALILFSITKLPFFQENKVA